MENRLVDGGGGEGGRWTRNLGFIDATIAFGVDKQ